MKVITTLWEPDPTTFSVTYPIEEILRRADLKATVWDRDFPLVRTGGGFFQTVVGRLQKFMGWKQSGIKKVKVYYHPHYYVRNAHTIRLLDPIHTEWVLKYEGAN